MYMLKTQSTSCFNFRDDSVSKARFILDMLLVSGARDTILNNGNPTMRALREQAIHLYARAAQEALAKGDSADARTCFRSFDFLFIF
jgi:hypothetical protein